MAWLYQPKYILSNMIWIINEGKKNPTATFVFFPSSKFVCSVKKLCKKKWFVALIFINLLQGKISSSYVIIIIIMSLSDNQLKRKFHPSCTFFTYIYLSQFVKYFSFFCKHVSFVYYYTFYIYNIIWSHSFKCNVTQWLSLYLYT